MANTYRRYALTGGTSGSLDDLDGSNLAGGDMAITVGSDDRIYFHKLDASSGETESSPDIIAPDTNAGTKRWILLQSSHTIYGGVGISFEATAKPTASGEYSFLMPYGMTILFDCAGSVFYNATNPTAQVVVSIEDDGTEIATLTVATNGTPTWSSAGATIAVGSRVSFVFPAQDATWAGVAITLQGVRTIS